MDEAGSPGHHQPDLEAVSAALEARFGDGRSRDEVEVAVRRAADEILEQAKVQDFLELLIERRARELLQGQRTTSP